MKYFLYVILLFVSIRNVSAQGKEDQILPLGYGMHWEGTNPPFGYIVVGGQLLNFEENSTSMSLQPFPTKAPLASICSPQGEIIAFTDGCRVANKEFKLMKNGEQINLGGIYDEYCVGVNSSIAGPYPLYQGFQLLPCPGNPDKYFLLEENMSPIEFDVDQFKYCVIGFKSDTLGEVIEKDLLIFDGAKLTNYVTSVKHANGQDWWSIIPNTVTNLYHICLVTKLGVNKVNEQHIGFAPDSPMGEEGGQICFSPDGSKFIKYLPNIGVYIFDFDRCEGVLSNPVFINQINYPVSNGGVAISPNNRFLYVSASNRIDQYDLMSPDIEASKIEVAVWDGFEGPFGTLFGQTIAAPDGKIYIITGNNHYLHVVEYPNEQGMNCNARPHGFRTLSLTYILAPNVPHFRLGPVDGSVCDSLGINNQPMADFRWHHADSSDLLSVSFRNLAWGEPQTWYWDFGDGTSSTDTSAVHTYASAGTYSVCQIVSNQYGVDTLCREVNITLPSSAVENPAVLNYQAEILPNPTRGQCYIMSTGEQGLIQQVILYDQLGREVLQKQWIGESTALDLNRLSSGMYFWKVFSNNRLLQSGKVIKGD